MSAEVGDVSLIQDEDLLRRMVSDQNTLLPFCVVLSEVTSRLSIRAPASFSRGLGFSSWCGGWLP
jgi:hypothetical protein